MTWRDRLRELKVCEEALVWAGPFETFEAAWLACARPDWMLWLAGKSSVDRKTIVTIACEIARTALKYVPNGEDRPRIAIETAERWVAGQATVEELLAARAAADAAAYAAWAAAWTARAAWAAADASAGAAADAAAWAAADAAARDKSYGDSAAIIRKHVTATMIETGWEVAK